jgi:hypothetical protein
METTLSPAPTTRSRTWGRASPSSSAERNRSATPRPHRIKEHVNCRWRKSCMKTRPCSSVSKKADQIITSTLGRPKDAKLSSASTIFVSTSRASKSRGAADVAATAAIAAVCARRLTSNSLTFTRSRFGTIQLMMWQRQGQGQGNGTLLPPDRL